MADIYSRKPEVTPEERKIRRRRRSVLIVMSEAVLLLMLAITAYGTSVLTSYQREDLSPSIYRETQQADRTKSGKSGKNDKNSNTEEPATKITVIEETNAKGEVIGSQEVAIPVSQGSTGYRNILILGLDARSQSLEKGTNTDVMIIASINNETGEVKLVSILRDTIMKMEDGCDTAYNKCNHQFAFSGLSDTVSMLNRNLGLDIGEYVIVNWRGVAQVINNIGGLELTIPNEEILGYFNGYLTFTNKEIDMWAPQIQSPGTYVLTGPQVVAFCRIRYGGYNDFGRTQNQREVIQKTLERVKELLKNGEYNRVIETAQIGLSSVRTNLTLKEVLGTSTQLQQYTITGTAQFPADDFVTDVYVGNYWSKYGVDWPLVANNFADQVKKLHQFLFNDYDYEPSAAIQNFSYQMHLDILGQ